MAEDADEQWFRCVNEEQSASRNFVWLPHAGGGAAPLFRCRREVPEDANLFVVTLPGRETRFHDRHCDTLMELVTTLDATMPAMQSPPVLIGHSYGALVAYLLAKHQSQAGRPPQGLVVMTMNSPDQVERRESIIHLDDDEFIKKLDSRYGGVPKVLLDHPDAMQAFLPTVRHDLTLLDMHHYEPAPPLPIPIRALAGSSDKMASRTAMQGWRAFTDQEFSLRVFPGDHFFPLQNVGAVLANAARCYPD